MVWSFRLFWRRYPTNKNVWQGGLMIPGIMEDFLELVSVLSLPAGLGQLVGVAFWARLSGVPHHPNCQARSIYDTWSWRSIFRIPTMVQDLDVK